MAKCNNDMRDEVNTYKARTSYSSHSYTFSCRRDMRLVTWTDVGETPTQHGHHVGGHT